MSTKKILLAMPLKMLEQVDTLALVEHRNRSDLLREAVRRYLQNANHQNQSVVIPAVQDNTRNDFMNGGRTIG